MLLIRPHSYFTDNFFMVSTAVTETSVKVEIEVDLFL